MLDGFIIMWLGLICVAPFYSHREESQRDGSGAQRQQRLDKSRLRVEQREFARESSNIKASSMGHDTDMVVPHVV